MAIHSPYTGIVDYNKVCAAYAEDLREAGVDIYTGYKASPVNIICFISQTSY